ncbi:MAG: hypothetical protein ACQESP_00050 [Candidatus Muiribacteriota bacterium]
MMFKCSKCDFIIDERKVEKCPGCGEDNLIKLNAEQEEKISNSREENDLLMELSGLVSNCIEISLELNEIMETGSDEKLIEKMLTNFPEIRALIYSRLAENVKNEKWG